MELQLAPAHVVLSQGDDTRLLYPRNLPVPGACGRCTLIFQRSQILLLESVLPLVEGLPRNTEVSAGQRSIPLCLGLPEDDPLQSLAGCFGETEELGLLSPSLMLGEKMDWRKPKDGVTDSFDSWHEDEIVTGNHASSVPKKAREGYYRCISSSTSLGVFGMIVL